MIYYIFLRIKSKGGRDLCTRPQFECKSKLYSKICSSNWCKKPKTSRFHRHRKSLQESFLQEPVTTEKQIYYDRIKRFLLVNLISLYQNSFTDKDIVDSLWISYQIPLISFLRYLIYIPIMVIICVYQLICYSITLYKLQFDWLNILEIFLQFLFVSKWKSKLLITCE